MSHPSGDTSAYLTFRAGSRFALPLDHVHELLPLVELSQPPAASAIVAGVINVSGTAVTVIRIASLLGLEEPPVTIHSHLIRLKAGDAGMALLCERVDGIRTADMVSFVFLTEGATFNGCVSARITSENGLSSYLIDCQRLLMEEERRRIGEYTERAQRRLAELGMLT